jgi:hypothetical protein
LPSLRSTSAPFEGLRHCFVRLHRKPALHGFDAAEAAIMTTVLKGINNPIWQTVVMCWRSVRVTRLPFDLQPEVSGPVRGQIAACGEKILGRCAWRLSNPAPRGSKTAPLDRETGRGARRKRTTQKCRRRPTVRFQGGRFLGSSRLGNGRNAHLPAIPGPPGERVKSTLSAHFCSVLVRKACAISGRRLTPVARKLSLIGPNDGVTCNAAPVRSP